MQPPVRLDSSEPTIKTLPYTHCILISGNAIFSSFLANITVCSPSSRFSPPVQDYVDTPQYIPSSLSPSETLATVIAVPPEQAKRRQLHPTIQSSLRAPLREPSLSLPSHEAMVSDAPHTFEVTVLLSITCGQCDC